MSMQKHGSCLCGAVRVTAVFKSNKVGVCHCGMCRKWGGGPLMTVDCEPGVAFEGREHIAAFASSAWAERAFCRHCGSHLYYRLKDGDELILSLGLFDELDDLVLDHQIFIDKKPGFYSFANRTHTMTEAEVFAKFAPE
ncbi:aldehyde-activating protein [Zobellella endophytica]|uniref:Aldehyde-activating protein n=1 Tax=Zobellella endophytica TaxID=2116700 RepID=A0A2P7RBS1_9GAMM|nr:GFA family protein [Zobellella endophytica]PSJ47665.1 aldehyde-activating protein [Zobellella endophytica]